MPSIEYSGMKITGGKMFAILTLLSALGGAAWTGFTFYQDYLDMKEKITLYTEPDLSQYDEGMAVLKSEIDMICLLYTSPSPRDLSTSRMPSSA